MTKNRARKHAARERAAVTGERYTVARRATAEHQPSSPSRMHELMHRIPGVPGHLYGGLQGTASRRRGARPSIRTRPRHNEPRVLVAWQNWIARRLSVGGH